MNISDLRISDIGKTIKVTSLSLEATGKLVGFNAKDRDTHIIGKGFVTHRTGTKVTLIINGGEITVPSGATLEITEAH